MNTVDSDYQTIRILIPNYTKAKQSLSDDHLLR